MKLTVEDRRERFAQWSVMSDEEKALLGLPLTRAAFAVHIGSSDKTLQRDGERPEHPVRCEEIRSRRLAQVGAVDAGSALAAVDAARDVSVESLDAVVPRAMSKLVALSEAGSLEATKVLLGMPTVKAWLDLQAREADSDYSDTPVSEMAAQVCELVGPDPLADCLRAAGWSCTPPAELAG